MRRGISLVEVLVGLAVFAMLLTATVSILVPALRAWMRAGAQGDLENGLLVTVRQLTRHVELTDVATVVLTGTQNGSNGIVYASVNPQVAGLIGPDCSLTWQGYEAWYVAPDPHSPITSQALYLQKKACTFQPGQIRSYPFAPDLAHDRVMMRNVVTFLVTATTAPTFNSGPVIYNNPIHVALQGRTDRDVQAINLSITCHLNRDLEPYTQVP